MTKGNGSTGKIVLLLPDKEGWHGSPLIGWENVAYGRLFGISTECHASSSLNPEVVDDPVLGDGGRLRLAQPPLQVLGELLGVAQLGLVVVNAPRHVLDGQECLLQLLGQGQGRICSMMVEWCFHIL